jgi:hypothetical protein
VTKGKGTTASAEGRICTRCRASVEGGVAVCARCGHPVQQAPSSGSSTVVKRRLLMLLGLAVVLAFALRTWTKPGRAGDKCRGGEHVTVEWSETSPAVARMDLPRLEQIDPLVTPYVRRAVLRHRGNATYADKCVHEYGHNHQPAVDEAHRAGGNAFFHAPPRSLGDDQFEVTTTVVVAHPGPVPRAIRDRHFPGGRAVQVIWVGPGSPAERAGLARNDLIVAVDGRPTPADAPAIMDLAAAVPAGGQLTFEVIRAGAAQTVRMTRDGDKIFGFRTVESPILETTP